MVDQLEKQSLFKSIMIKKKFVPSWQKNWSGITTIGLSFVFDSITMTLQLLIEQ